MKETLSEHYDNVSNNLNIEKLKSYGSKDINQFLRAPYIYIEDNFILNTNLNNKNILDYCCGNGSYSILPALNEANVYGVDISDKSIELAKKRSEIFSEINSLTLNPVSRIIVTTRLASGSSLQAAASLTRDNSLLVKVRGNFFPLFGRTRCSGHFWPSQLIR